MFLTFTHTNHSLIYQFDLVLARDFQEKRRELFDFLFPHSQRLPNFLEKLFFLNKKNLDAPFYFFVLSFTFVFDIIFWKCFLKKLNLFFIQTNIFFDIFITFWYANV
jgi:hypothetical protein